MSLDGFITIDSSVDTSSSGLYVTGLPGVTIAQLDGLTRDEQADFEAFFATLYAAAQVNLKIDVQRALAQRFHIDKKQITRETSKFISDELTASEISGVKIEVSLSKYSQIHLLSAQVYCNDTSVENLTIDWQSAATTLSFFPLDCVYAQGKFVVVGQGIATSADGITWTERTNPNTNTWRAVTYGNGRFVAVAGSTLGNDPRVMHSPDGITWTETIYDDATIQHDWKTVKWIEELKLFVAGGGSGGYIMTSYNGEIWVDQAVAGAPDIEEFAYGNGVLVGVTNQSGEVLYSTDGLTWAVEANAGVIQEDVAFGNGVFVSGSTSDTFLYSTDGITWTAGTYFGDVPANSPPWGSIVFTGEYFVATSSEFIATSSDGINWYEAGDVFYSSGETNALFFGGGTFVFLHSETPLYGTASSEGAQIDVVIYDTDEDGDLLGTFSTTAVEGKNIIPINTSFDVEDLFVAFTPPVSGFRQTENKYFPTDSLSVDKLSCTFPCHFGDGSVTQVNGGGINVKFNVVCSLEKFIEENINIFQYALWYRIGVDLMKERIVSDRVNRFVVLTPERATELMAVYNEDYKAALDSATMNIRMNEDPICFTCKRPIKAVTSLP